MAYYLNHTFLAGLPAADQALVQFHDWTTEDMANYTDPTQVARCQVGLISYSEYQTYKPLIPRLDSDWWTRTMETAHTQWPNLWKILY